MSDTLKLPPVEWLRHREQTCRECLPKEAAGYPHAIEIAEKYGECASTILALTAEVERLKAMLDRIYALDDFPELTSGMRTGLFCGVEDRNLTDRYDGAEYGWDDAAERCAEWAKNMSVLTPQPPTHCPTCKDTGLTGTGRESPQEPCPCTDHQPPTCKEKA